MLISSNNHKMQKIIEHDKSIGDQKTYHGLLKQLCERDAALHRIERCHGSSTAIIFL